MPKTSWKTLLVLFVALVFAGCDSFFAPRDDDGLPDGELVVIHVDPDSPPLVTTEVEFWLVRGVETVVEIRYATAGSYNGKCLRLVIPADAPLRDPEGRPIAPGDSIQAKVRVLDAGLFLFDLEPTGLLLNPASPARMEVRYRWLSDDVNGDGVVDATDDRARERFGIWARDPETLRWSSVTSTRFEDIQEVHAPVTLFTRYALASD